MATSDLDLAQPSPRFWEADPPPSPSQASTNGTFQVSYSGQSIIYSPTDAQGNALAVTSLRNTDDVQVLSIVDVPAGNSLTLQLGSTTTAPIPLQPAPPLTSFVWSATLPQAGSYDLWLAWGNSPDFAPAHACLQAVLDVLDGTTKVGTVTLDQTNFPDPATDLAIMGVGVFKSLGTFKLKSTNLQLHLSGAAGSGVLLAGMVRVVPHGVTDPAQVGYIDPTPNRAAGSDGTLEDAATYSHVGGWTLSYYAVGSTGYHGYWYASATGTMAAALPTAAALQTALQGLANVPSGSVSVTAITSQIFSIHFMGALAGSAQPTLTSSDPAFTITHDDTGGSSVGGQFPHARINGVDYPLRAASYAPNRPTVLFYLVQDAPLVQSVRLGEQTFVNSGYPPVAYGAGLSQRTAPLSQSGQVGSCRFDGLPGPASYQIAITWPTGFAQVDGLTCTIVDRDGTTLATTAFIDQSQAPGDFQEDGVGWHTVGQFPCVGPLNSLVVLFNHTENNGKYCLLDAIRIARISPNQSVQIQPTDTVLFSAPAGFVSTVNGPMPAAQLVPVAAADAYRLPPPSAGVKTMKIGTNCDYPAYYNQNSCFSNIAIQALTPIGLAQGPDGAPTKLSASGNNTGAAATRLSQPSDDGSGSGWGVPNSSNGVWVVQWTSATGCTCGLFANSGTTTVTEDVTRRVTGAVNRRYYQVEDPYYAAPWVGLSFSSTTPNTDGTYACDVHNVAVYPPDVDPDNPGRWRPSFLSKVKQFHCFRFMDMFGTNFLNLASASDFPQPQNFPLGYGGRSLRVPIATIGPPTPDPFADFGSGFVVRVTTKVPHGLASGFFVTLANADGSSLGQVVGNEIDPKTNQTTTTPCTPLDFPGSANICHVIDATTLQITLETYVGPLGRMSNTLTPANAYLSADVATGAMMAPADAAQLCLDAGVEPWVNVPWLADDDCVTQMAQAFVAKNPVGTEVHVEYGNEAWNFGFNGFGYACRQGTVLFGTNIDYVPWYTTRLGQVHTIFRNVWTQAGRDPNEIRRVAGSQQSNAGGTLGRIIDFAVAQGITFDEVAPASYVNNGPLQGAYDDLLTSAQLLDLLAVNVRLSDTTRDMLDQTNIINQAVAKYPQQTWLATLDLVNYEGGPGSIVTNSMTGNIARLNHAVSRDPGMFEILLYQVQTLQDSGVKLFNIFTLFGVRAVDQWGVYESFNQANGTGNVLLDPANRNDFENLLLVKSEKGGALKQWRTLMSPPVAPWVSLRNGDLLAYGQPRY